MTVDDLIYKVKRDSPIPLGSDWVEENLRPALHALLRTETERNAAVLTEVIDTLDSQVEEENYARLLLEGCEIAILRTAPGGGG